MPQQKAGGGLLAKVSRTPAPSQTFPDPSIGVSHSTPATAVRHVPASRIARKPLRTTLLVTLGLAALCAAIVGLGMLAEHLPSIIVGLCIIVLGMVFGAMLAARA